jgi:uncharacterized protein
MTIAAVLAALAALGGHAFIWIGLVNRLHAAGLPRRTIKLGTLAMFLCAALMPLGIRYWWPYYTVLCWAAAATTLLRLICLRCLLLRRPPLVRFHGRRPADIRLDPAADGECVNHVLTRLPLNEFLRPEVSEWTLEVPRLPPALDGLRIVHVSDVHLTGRVGKAYFREVVRISNELQPDLTAVTGDLVDNPACLDWLPDTLGRLTARHGVYFILGNHDLRIGDPERVRRPLRECGLVDLGGREQQIEIGGHPVLLAGNERPWFDGRVRAGTHQSHGADDRCVQARTLRIALAHCPDQLPWARRWDADLMLAGHTHGGQIRIPPLGAIFSPTRHGVKYASGVFYAPPTILHVSRGISGDTPVRWNCPPEITCLRLRTSPDYSPGLVVAGSNQSCELHDSAPSQQ